MLRTGGGAPGKENVPALSSGTGALGQRAGERRHHPSGALGRGSCGRQAHGWTPRPVGFLGPLFFAQLPSVYLSEQGGSHKEILDHIWVQQSHLEGFSSIPLLLASRAIFPLRCFASRIGNNQWMIPILIWIFREAEEFLHSFSHLTTVIEQPLCRRL